MRSAGPRNSASAHLMSVSLTSLSFRLPLPWLFKHLCHLYRASSHLVYQILEDRIRGSTMLSRAFLVGEVVLRLVRHCSRAFQVPLVHAGLPRHSCCRVSLA